MTHSSGPDDITQQELDFGFDWTALTLLRDHMDFGFLFTSKEEFVQLLVSFFV